MVKKASTSVGVKGGSVLTRDAWRLDQGGDISIDQIAPHRHVEGSTRHNKDVVSRLR